MNIFDELKTSGESGVIACVGEVTAVDAANCRARVTFDDDDSVTSDWLQVLQFNSLHNSDYHLPDIGEDVLCLFLAKESGFILGSFYAGEVQPIDNNLNVRSVKFADGTRVVYDRNRHELDIFIDGTRIIFNRETGEIVVPRTVTIVCTSATVKASGDVTIDTPETSITGSLTVAGPITGMGGLSVSGGSGAAVTVSGNVSFDGAMQATGDVVAGGISLISHTHPGDSGGMTGEPQ